MNDTMFIKRIHLLGIGGTGMSGIAEVLFNLGYQVSGTDITKSKVTNYLENLGIKVFYQHQVENLAKVDVVIRSSAIAEDNPEVIAAKMAHIPIIPRAQMLAELMRFNFGIAITGTHGKTSTTSLLSSILTNANLDPTFVIGGILKQNRSNSRLGRGKFFIIEADESDSSFLYFTPIVAIVTNIEPEHLEAYNNDFKQLKNSFVKFIERLPFYGLAVVCYDDPVIRQLLPQFSRTTITYGFDPEAEVVLSDYRQIGFKSYFKINFRKTNQSFRINLNLPGKHYALNAVAAMIVAQEAAGLEPKVILESLANFSGVGRRMEQYGQFTIKNKTITLVDDYGHHPTEIKVTIQTLRQALPQKRLVLIFQPHRFTRTLDFFEQFVELFGLVDAAILLDIYPANEPPIPGITSQALANAIQNRFNHKVNVFPNLSQLLIELPNIIQDNDLLLVQGAGNIGNLAPLIKRYEA